MPVAMKSGLQRRLLLLLLFPLGVFALISVYFDYQTAGNVAVVTLNGRALSLSASVTLVNTVINVPAP